MIITFYTISDDSKVLNKNLGKGIDLDCTLRTPIDYINPSFYIKQFQEGFNYCKWQDRFYFINQVSYNADKSYKLSCSIDNLMTYKADIEKSNSLGNVKLEFNNPFNEKGINILLGITNL